MQDFVGKHINRYRIIAQQGIGGMSVVYKAYDTRLERDVALKLIRSEAIPAEQHPRLMQRFEREARAQGRFSHPNIVPAYDYGEVDGIPYLVLAYMPGGTLKERIRGAMPVEEALRIMAPIADAVAYAHRMGVLHRDIKPSNILFSGDERPMLSDFGIAKLLETTEATLTGTGLGVGTPEYMAPEQWQGQACEATDQYALGVVLYELLTGQKPYTADTPLAVALKQMNDPLPSPKSLNSAIPEELEKVLYKALAPTPQDRYETISVFISVLVSQMHEAGTVLLDTASVWTGEKSETVAQLPEVESESETIDLYGTTYPPTSTKQPGVGAIKPKSGLHSWQLWVGLGILLIVLIYFGAAILVGRPILASRLSEPVASDETPQAALIISTQIIPMQPGATSTMHTNLVPTLLSPTATGIPLPTSTPTDELTLGAGLIMVNPIDGAQMVYIPEGVFIMGSNPSEDPYFWGAEAHAHEVYVDAFWIYQTEVTNAMYKACVAEQACPKPSRTESRTVADYYTAEKYALYPVIQVNWGQAVAYCQWAGGRLPSEAEWEKAARGTDGRLFPWGNSPLTPELASFCGTSCLGDERENFDDGYPEIAPVGMFPAGASPYGALDMAGNVWEWVFDYFDTNYYSISPYDNPRGPLTGNRRVIRGGSWFNPIDGLRTVSRASLHPQDGLDTVGFRCVYPAEK